MKEVKQILQKVLLGERISFHEGVTLLEEGDLFTLGSTADEISKKLHGENVYYRLNAHLNYTNICINSCKICAFSRKAGEEGAYQMSLSEVEDYLQGLPFKPDELHITGSLNPGLPYEYYPKMLELIRKLHPQALIKGFTAVEIDHLSKIAGKEPEEVLSELKQKGLDLLPGGGADIFAKRLREKIAQSKISAERWLSIHASAHKLGIPTSATVLYGHLETSEDIIDHLLQLRELQDKTGLFTSLVPLRFHPSNTELSFLEPPGVFLDLKIHAIARIMLDNFPHIKAYWVTAGIELAPVLLCFGASDLHGSVYRERIVGMAGARSPSGLSEEELCKIIKDAGKVPVRAREKSLYNYKSG